MRGEALVALLALEDRGRRARIGFGAGNLALAAFALYGVFRLLPSRWWVVDGGAIVVALLLVASGVTLLARHRAAERVTRVAAGVVLALGMALFAAVVATATWISGVYGQVGTSGALVFGLVAALLLPYLVVYPAVMLAWVGPRAAPAPAAPVAAPVVTPETAPVVEPPKDTSKKKKRRK